MEVLVNGWAWLPKKELEPAQIVGLKDRLTVTPIRTSQEQQEDPEPIPLWTETEEHLGIAREFFFEHRRPVHKVKWDITEGSKDWHPAEFSGQLRPEQDVALKEIVRQFEGGRLGGIVQAKPGWGKTVTALAIAAKLNVPTLVIVHKKFLMDQWMDRIQGVTDPDPAKCMPAFLPDARVGLIQQGECNFEGKTIVIGMVHSLGSRDYPEELYRWPGLIIVDECHRIGARTWAPVPPKFHAKYRLGFSATPRRKDRADAIFWNHLGPVLFVGKEQRLTPKIKRVWTKFKLVKTDRFNPNLANRSLLLKFLCASRHRNDTIADQLIKAVASGRKCIVLSERINHLERIEKALLKLWPDQYGEKPTTDYYIGGRKKHEYAEAAKARVIFATSQYAAEGLDIPTLDTLFLVSPMSDVEQAVGRIQRPHPDKKDPVVVDFRDDSVPMFEAQGRKRERFYERVV
jgi:superfamily II DNA or RNA helicase